MKLNHYLARSGVCSRRNALFLIQQGDVAVNNVTVKKPGYTVQQSDVVTYKKKVLTLEQPIYLLINKPAGYVTTAADEQGRKTIFNLLPSNIRARLFAVGRLDQDTTGILLLTNDGELAQQLAHPRYQVSKGYKVTLDRPLTPEDARTLKKGVRLRDGRAAFDKCIIHPKAKQIATVFIHSGKKRIIRRLFAHLNYQVRKLDRVSFAGLTARGLKVGAWRLLTTKEIEQLHAPRTGSTQTRN